MPKQAVQKDQWADADLPVLGTWHDCRQLSEDTWQGIDEAGAVRHVTGGKMPVGRKLQPAATTNVAK